jgi:hypothetical protein
MPGPKRNSGKSNGNRANLGFEVKLWQAAEYKHVVVGLIFLKYISDAFQERYDALGAEPHADPQDRDLAGLLTTTAMLPSTCAASQHDGTGRVAFLQAE